MKMMNKETLVRRTVLTPSNLCIREAAEGQASRTIEGYAILFGVPSVPLWKEEDGEAREVIDSSAVTREVLDGCDIKMTMFHDRQLILARSRNGEGTLSYEVDDKGVRFSFEAPATVDGDKALELVRRGDISGCSFMFSTYYYDESFVERSVEVKDGYAITTYRVKAMTGVYDFTLAADPAYPDTSVEARELVETLREPETPEDQEPVEEKNDNYREQVAQMRATAARKIV